MENDEYSRESLAKVWQRTNGLTETILMPLTDRLRRSLDVVMHMVRLQSPDTSIEEAVREAIYTAIWRSANQYRDEERNWKELDSGGMDALNQSLDELLEGRLQWPHQMEIPVSKTMKRQFSHVARTIYPRLKLAELEFLQEAMAAFVFSHKRKHSALWHDPTR